MKKKDNFLAAFFKKLAYKKKPKAKSFYIPEINEHSGNAGAGPQDPAGGGGAKKEGKGQGKRSQKASGAAAVSTDINENLEFISQSFNLPENADIIIRQFTIAGEVRAFMAYIDGLVNKQLVSISILRPVLSLKSGDFERGKKLIDFIINNVIEISGVKKSANPSDAIYGILAGKTALYVDGCDSYALCETQMFEKRAVETPRVENIVRGPQEGFTEDLKTNVALLRRIFRNKNLVSEYLNVGYRNNIQCAVVYVKDIINPAIVKEIKRRINSIDVDAVIGDGVLGQLIEDEAWSLVPTMLTTERPDRTAYCIAEGRAAIIMEGSPFAIIVPVTLFSLLHSPEDFFLKWPFAILLRFIRLLSLFLAALLPALYIAITTFHREMIPTDLLISIIKAKENVPFPTVLEILLMEVSFELIREAGVRMPGIVGQTLGIIGALILGQAAVQANVVSPVLIIIIAATGLGNFAIPNFDLAFAVRILRFIFIFASAVLGFYGITLVLVALTGAIASMKSFGVPFLSTAAPRVRKSFDSFIMWPIWKQEMRPDVLNPLDTRKQAPISRKWTKEDPDSGYRKGEDDA